MLVVLAYIEQENRYSRVTLLKRPEYSLGSRALSYPQLYENLQYL